MSESVLSSPSGSASHVEDALASHQPRSNHSIVRTAQPEDEAGIIDLCRQLHDENGLFSMDSERVRTLLRRAWARDNVIIGVIGPIGAPIGTVGLEVADIWYACSPCSVINEIWNIVHHDLGRACGTPKT